MLPKHRNAFGALRSFVEYTAYAAARVHRLNKNAPTVCVPFCRERRTLVWSSLNATNELPKILALEQGPPFLTLRASRGF